LRIKEQETCLILHEYDDDDDDESIISPVDLYLTKVLCRIIREERRLRVFENRVLREVFGPKMEEITGEWRILHNEELNDMYCSQNIIRMIKSRSMG
jgi:hypothetical protein